MIYKDHEEMFLPPSLSPSFPPPQNKKEKYSMYLSIVRLPRCPLV